MRVCGRDEWNVGTYLANLGVIRGENDDVGKFSFFLKNFNFHHGVVFAIFLFIY
jgi:hypothetical protein